MSQPCVCGGTNENCMHCQGSGYFSGFPTVDHQTVDRWKRSVRLASTTFNPNERSIRINVQGPSNGTGQRITLGFVACQFCQVQLRLKNVVRHRQRCPKLRQTMLANTVDSTSRSARTPYDTGSQRGLPPTSRLGRAQRAHDQVSGRDRFDETREFFVLRENGRFGSHPVHDAFGDESGPG